MEKLSDIVNNRMKNQVFMGIMLLLIVTLISCKMPEITDNNMAVDSKEDNIQPEVQTQGEKKETKKVVIIDPGHGGIDPGKIGINGDLEKNINLEISIKLKNILEQNGYIAVLTRDSDIGLYDEYDKNKKQADMWVRRNFINMHHENDEDAICVSIHQNSYSDSSVMGPQVFYYEKSGNGKGLADCIQTAMNTELGVATPRGAADNDSYYLLLHTTCPTVIVECGFLSSSDESYMLINDDYQTRIAYAILSGIESFQQSR